MASDLEKLDYVWIGFFQINVAEKMHLLRLSSIWMVFYSCLIEQIKIISILEESIKKWSAPWWKHRMLSIWKNRHVK